MLDMWLKLVLLRLLSGLAVIRKIGHIGCLSIPKMIIIQQITPNPWILLGTRISAHSTVILGHGSLAINLILIVGASSVVRVAMSKLIRSDSAGNLVLWWGVSLLGCGGQSIQVLSHFRLLLGYEHAETLLPLVAGVDKHGFAQMVLRAIFLLEQALIPSAGWPGFLVVGSLRQAGGSDQVLLRVEIWVLGGILVIESITPRQIKLQLHDLK